MVDYNKPVIVQNEYFKLQGDNNVLLCPNCDSSYLCQERVVIFDRNEDAKETQVTEVVFGEAKTVTKDSEFSGNPSRRRHGLLIQFACEGCEDHPKLAVYQHKGETFVEWRG